MPVLKTDDKKKQMLAVAAVSPENQIVAPAPNAAPLEQPRQPSSLQGLLRFAMEATKAEDAPERPSAFQPLDEERRQFLESTLNGMIGNPVEEMEKSVKVLADMETVDDDTDPEEVEKYINNFEYLTDFVGQIDLANAFHKINGLSVFGPALHGRNAEIQMAACDLLAELCQNNPYWQDVIVHTEILSILLDILKKNEDAAVGNKALYALSCITREHMDCYKRFVTYGGLTVLKEVVSRDVDQHRARASRLLTSLCRLDKGLAHRLCTLDYIPTLLSTLQHQRRHQPSNEQIVELLQQIVTEYAQGMDDCLQENPQLPAVHILADNVDRLVQLLDAREAGEEEELPEWEGMRWNRWTGVEEGDELANLTDKYRNNEEYINCRRLIYLIQNIREILDN